MSDYTPERVKDIISSLEEDDLSYTEDLMKDAYKFEVDRKDKILTSMSVITAPITILFAGVAFLTNNALDTGQRLLTYDPNLALLALYITFAVLIWKLVSLIYSFNNLLSGENYTYLANANDLLNGVVSNKEFCIDNALATDGAASRFSRIDTIIQLSESSTRNCNANDIRLQHRQKIFKNTVVAITCAAVGFVAVAIHREWPNMSSISTLWKEARGPASENSHPASSSTASTIRPTPPAVGNEPAVATPPAASPPPSHQ